MFSLLFELQVACEDYVVGLLKDTNSIAIHDKRVTITREDLLFASQLRCNGD